MSNSGRSLELFFIDGRPDGMLTAQVFNWTGHVLRAPRTQIKEALARPEADHTGVYILIGEQDGDPLAYIGEAEELGRRLREHVRGKDWWDTVVLVTTTANNLHKAHIKYLEARLVEIARTVASVPLENGNTPPRSSLSEADVANMEGFLDMLSTILPAIRVDMFMDKSRQKSEKENPSSAGSQPDENTFTFQVPKRKLSASALLLNGEIVVRTGSKVSSKWIGSARNNPGYSRLFQELLQNGVIVSHGETAEFATDFAFSSPSAAAAIVSGRAANGRTSWIHDQTGQTYQDWESSQIERETT